MQKFEIVTSRIAYLALPNIDTDMLIPKQFLKTIERNGLGKALFAELRYDANHQPKPDFVLNQPEYQHAQILMAEENFGCGSSREHAVWALLDFGIKVVIAPSFADIFYGNCFKNGILPITVSHAIIQKLAQCQEAVSIDLAKQMIITADQQIPFEIAADRKMMLLQGWDEIALTLAEQDKIKAFEQKHRQQQPWLYEGNAHA